MTTSAPSFVLLGELASGGMGTVDLVRMSDASGERVVAMKRMHPHFAKDAEFLQMFRDEIWLTQALRHPNVVELLGWGEDDGGPYLVMEFVSGAPLAELMYHGRRRNDPIPQELVAFVAARVAEGLHAAHALADEHGKPLALVHRDITPSNVLVGFDGSVKITDFGIAKAAASSAHTRTGIVKGKIEYMSPEHALRRTVDGRSDLYSLGVVVFEALAGAPPVHGGSDLDLLKRVAYEPVPKLAAIAPEVDPELAAIVDRLLAKSPNERLPNGAAAARAFDDWLTRRGHDRAELQARLAAYSEKRGAPRARRLAKLLAQDGVDLGSSDNWRRRESVRPPGGTRAVSVPPPPMLPVIATPAPVAAPPSAPGVTRRVGMVPAPLEPTLILRRRKRRRWPIVLGASVVSALALAAIVLAVRPAPEPAEPSVEPIATAGPVTIAPVAEPEPEPQPAAALPEPEPTASEEAPAEPPPRAGQPRRPTTRVQKRPTPSSGSKPCTPDRFDYPACLSRR